MPGLVRAVVQGDRFEMKGQRDGVDQCSMSDQALLTMTVLSMLCSRDAYLLPH